MRTLLDRKIDLGLRDGDGYTPRDYLAAMDTEISHELIQMIDEYVVHKVSSRPFD